jgi:hypothetical protein
VNSELGTLPPNVAASITFSIPKDSVEFENEKTYFDTMNAAHPFPDFDKLNKWDRSKTISVSVSYNALKLDLYEAGFLMKHVRKCIEDPDYILL